MREISNAVNLDTRGMFDAADYLNTQHNRIPFQQIVQRFNAFPFCFT